MFKMQRVGNRGSITVETTMVLGMLLIVIVTTIYMFFYMHDYTVVQSQAIMAVDHDETFSRRVTLMAKVEDVEKSVKGEKNIIEGVMKIKLPFLGTVKKTFSVSRNITGAENIRRMKVLLDAIE